MPTARRTPDQAIADATTRVQEAEQAATAAWATVRATAQDLASRCANPDGPSPATLTDRMTRETAAATRATADLVTARRTLKAAITRRDTAAAEAASGLTPLRQVATALAERLNEGHVPGLTAYYAVTYRNEASGRHLTVSWHGEPNVVTVGGTVIDALPEIAGEGWQDITVHYTRTRRWSCGNFHRDAEAAFCAHEAAEEDLETRWTPTGEELTNHAWAHLNEEGRDAVSWCVEGDYENCPACWGDGTTPEWRKAVGIALNKRQPMPPREVCPACNGRRLLDLTFAADKAIYDTELPKAVEAARAHQAAEERRIARAQARSAAGRGRTRA